jgi:hypothetical protein
MHLSIYLSIYLASNCSKGDTLTSFDSSVSPVETAQATKQLERSCIGMADSVGLLATMFQPKVSTVTIETVHLEVITHQPLDFQGQKQTQVDGK